MSAMSLSRMLKNCCASLIWACAVLVRPKRSGPSPVGDGRCERAQPCCAFAALALMYSLCTFRFLRSGRAQLRPARDVFYHPAKSQRGIVLIAAIFLLVVIAALGGFMLTIGSLSNSASALDIEGAKAYQASRAGIEWGTYQVLRNSSCPASTSFSPGGTLSSFTTTVTCAAAPYSEVGAATTAIYTLISTACNRPSSGNCPGSAGDNYVERQLQVTLDK